MKKTLLIGLALLTTSVFSQQVELIEEGQTADVTGTMLEIPVAPDTEEYVTFDLNNLTGSATNIKVERLKLNDVGNDDYICWGADPQSGTCYAAGQVTPSNPWSSSPETIPTTAPGWFAAYYVHTGNPGEAIYRYYFLDASNNNALLDSVDIKWNPGVIGVEEEDSKTNLSVYPNPAQNQLNVNVGDNKGKLVMYDALGQKVLTSKVNGTAKVDVSTLNNGVYFYSFINENGVATESKRLVIRK